LLDAEPRDPAARLHLAASRNFLAGLWLDQGQTDLARNAFQDAVKAAEPSGGPDGKSEEAKYVLADGYAGLGSVARRTGPLPEAQSWDQRSLAVRARIAHPCPLSPNGFPTATPKK
jgi:hypothetical protein